jgi:superfamily II DNA or RNA helicase
MNYDWLNTLLIDDDIFPVTPWDHQRRAIPEILKRLRTHSAITVCMPTGAGKSNVSTALINLVGKCNGTASLFTNRKMLTKQTAENLTRSGVSYGVRAASMGHLMNLKQPIQISSMQTEISRCLAGSQPLHKAEIAVIDEAHLMAQGDSLKIIQRLLAMGTKVVLVTATPVGLSHISKELYVGATKQELFDCGAHVRAIIKSVAEMDLSRVRRVKEEDEDGNQQERFSLQDIRATAWNQAIVANVLEEYNRFNPDRRMAMGVAPGVPESRAMAEHFRRQGINSAHIDAKEVYVDGEYKTDNAAGDLRSEVIERWKAGDIQAVWTCQVLREGIDLPGLFHLMLATPILQLKDFVQTCGRVIRKSPETPDHVIIQDHGGNCLDSFTEVLTPDGWKGIDDEPFDTVAAYDEVTGEITWQQVTDRVRRKVCDGERMVSVNSRQMNLRVTEGHRMVFKTRKWVSNHKPPTWDVPCEITTAIDLHDNYKRFKFPVSGYMDAEGVDLTDSELEMLGWFLTDGHLEKRGKTLSFAQSIHQPHYHKLPDCLDRCGLDYRAHTTHHKNPLLKNTHPSTSFQVPKGTSKARPRNGFVKYLKYLDKDFSPHLEQLTRHQLEQLLIGMHWGNGDKARNPGSYRISTGSKVMCDRLQSLCVRRGIKCSVSIITPEYRNNLKSNIIRATEDLYILNIQLNTQFTTLHGSTAINKDQQAKMVVSKPEDGEEVWCVSNKIGTLVTRRDNVVAIVGNCYRHSPYGSPNVDVPWHELYEMDDLEISEHIDRRKKDDPDSAPAPCPKCGTLVRGGRRCPPAPIGCGEPIDQNNPRKLRFVVQESGQLEEFKEDGKSSAPRKVSTDSKEQKQWDRLFWAATNSKSPRGQNFNQLRASYLRAHGDYPPDGLNNMPKDPADMGRKVKELPRFALRTKYNTPVDSPEGSA